ncbi:MAG: hypothetical protein PHQ43_00160 [Dehalococcoidales bacterium]|nr:hypothetical protein [Dehalococcoidales bacterium]
MADEITISLGTGALRFKSLKAKTEAIDTFKAALEPNTKISASGHGTLIYKCNEKNEVITEMKI